MKNNFLKKFIEISSINGISEDSLYKASQEIYSHPKGFLIDYIEGLSEVVKECENYFDNALQDDDEIKNEKSVTLKIKKSLISRIYSDGKRKIFYKALSNYYFKNSNMLQAAKNRWSSVDCMWNLAGDKSTDYNYYTKRSLLFSIYNKAMHTYTNSKELNFEETSLVIDNSLEKIAKFNKFKKNFTLNNIPFIRVFTK